MNKSLLWKIPLAAFLLYVVGPSIADYYHYDGDKPVEVVEEETITLDEAMQDMAKEPSVIDVTISARHTKNN